MNLGTLVVLLIVIAIAALALRSVLKKKGGCDCGVQGDGCSHCEGCDTKVYGINTGPGIDQPTQCPHCK